MISTKKLVRLARKWQNLAALRRKRITLPTPTNANKFSTSGKSEKGFFVVYSMDQKRFSLPLDYLDNEVIRVLFDMAEEEFGLPGNGPLTLPCEAEIMEYAISLIRQKANRDVERALLTSIANNCSTLPFHVQHHVARHQVPICSC